jgi:hypothetical protein
METYQVKISLRDTHPRIWRRVLVRHDVTLGTLHRIVQRAMGWTDSHLHRFVYGSGRHFDLRFGLPSKVSAENKTKLMDVLTARGDRLLYECDFGDGWQHEVLLEQVLLHQDFFQPVLSPHVVLQENGHARRKIVEVPRVLLNSSTCCGILTIRSTRTDSIGSAMILTRNT